MTHNLTFLVATGIFIIFSLPIVIFDLKTMRIPDILTFSGIALLVILRLSQGWKSSLPYAIATVFSIALFFAVRYISRHGMGLGDVKYSALCALYAGLPTVFFGFIGACIFAAIFFLVWRSKRKKPIPFAPFMAIATLCAEFSSHIFIQYPIV